MIFSVFCQLIYLDTKHTRLKIYLCILYIPLNCKIMRTHTMALRRLVYRHNYVCSVFTILQTVNTLFFSFWLNIYIQIKLITSNLLAVYMLKIISISIKEIKPNCKAISQLYLFLFLFSFWLILNTETLNNLSSLSLNFF